MNRTLALALLGFAALTAGCASNSTRRVEPGQNTLADRHAFIERRSEELIRRGAPKDAALAKASGEWFNTLLAADQRAEDSQRAEQRRLEKHFAQMSRNRSDDGR